MHSMQQGEHHVWLLLDICKVPNAEEANKEGIGLLKKFMCSPVAGHAVQGNQLQRKNNPQRHPLHTCAAESDQVILTLHACRS